MEITIEEAQSNLRNIQRYYIKADNETIDCAIDILHKYQKIVQIMERTVDDETSMYDTLQEIEEVIYENE